MTEYVSAANLAEQLKISKPAVTKAIKIGRLTKSVRKKDNGRYEVNLEEALKEWRDNSLGEVGIENSLDESDVKKALANFDDLDEKDVPNYYTSKAVKEYYLGKLAKLEYEYKAGKLVSAEEQEKEGFKLGRIIRDGILNIPERISADLFSQKTMDDVYQLLRKEIVDVLTSLAHMAKHQNDVSAIDCSQTK